MLKKIVKSTKDRQSFEAKDGSKRTVTCQVSSYDSCLTEKSATHGCVQSVALAVSENVQGNLNKEQATIAENKNNSKRVGLNAKVFVMDLDGKSLLPTSPRRARLLLKSKKAILYSVVPFTIKLNRTVDNPIGSFTVGIDDGAKFVGMAVVNEHTKEVIFGGTIKLRQDVHRKMLQRAQYRQTRRSRNLRYRKARFSNRGTEGWISPTIRTKKDSILRVIFDLKKRLNITKAVIEQGQFDVSSLVKGRKLEGIEYQQSDYEGRNFREKILWRDKYTCQNCNSQDKLQAHHIRYRSKGGTHSVNNGITLCEKCHNELHDGIWALNIRPKQFKYPTHLQVGKSYLFNELKKRFEDVKICYGWMTAQWRKEIGIIKSHINDAISIVCKNYLPVIVSKKFMIIPKRTKVWEGNPTKTCTEKNGFKHWDLVKASHRTRGNVIGSIRSLNQKKITLRTQFDDNFPVSYSKTTLLWRFKGIVYV